MKDHPIIFSSEMVRAIMDGRKTQTRRIILPQPIPEPGMPGAWRIEMKPRSGYNSERTMKNYLPDRCPYGAKGDRLWVRERWAHDEPNCDDIHCGNPDHIWYYANESKIVADSFAGRARWRPSIHMERWASRMTLEITTVRVERVQEITVEDIRAEGIRETKDGFWLAPLTGVPDHPWIAAHLAFMSLWSHINDKRGYGWDANPWVWVIEFKKAGA